MTIVNHKVNNNPFYSRITNWFLYAHDSILLMLLMALPIQVYAEELKPVNPTIIAQKEALLKQSVARHQGYEEARLDALITHLELTLPQQESMHTMIAKSQNRLLDPALDGKGPALTPLVFGHLMEQSLRLQESEWTRELLSVLTEEQEVKWKQFLDKRALRLHRWFASQITKLVDDYLYLSDDQRERFNLSLDDVQPRFTNAFYVPFGHQYVPAKLLSEIPLPNDLLTPTQMEHWGDITNRRLRFRGFHMEPNVPNKLWKDKLYESYNQRMGLCRCMARVQVEYLNAQGALSNDLERRAILAGVGSVQRTLMPWLHQTYKRIEEYSQYPEITSEHISVMFPDEYLTFKSPIWQQILEDKRVRDAFSHREQLRRQESVDYFLAGLDQELWLNDEQCDQIRVLASDVAEGAMIQLDTYGYYGVFLFGQYLRGMPEDKVMSILSPGQQKAFQELSKNFFIEGGYFMFRAGIESQWLGPAGLSTLTE